MTGYDWFLLVFIGFSLVIWLFPFMINWTEPDFKALID